MTGPPEGRSHRRHERRGSRLVAQRERHLAPDAGVGVTRETGRDRHEVEICAPHRTVGGDAQRWIGLRLWRSRSLLSFGAELIEKINRAPADVGVGILE